MPQYPIASNWQVENQAGKNKIKELCYVIALIWILSGVPKSLSLSLGSIYFFMFPVGIAGLWLLKKWGLIAGYILSAIGLVGTLGALYINYLFFGISIGFGVALYIIMGIFWIFCIYRLYKNRNVFA